MTLQEQIDNLNCNAFLGVYYPINRHSKLSSYLNNNEEYIIPIDELLYDLKPNDIEHKDGNERIHSNKQ